MSFIKNIFKKKKYSQNIIYETKGVYLSGIENLTPYTDVELKLELDALIIEWDNKEKVIPLFNINVYKKNNIVLCIKNNNIIIEIEAKGLELLIEHINTRITNIKLNNIDNSYYEIDCYCYYVGGIPGVAGGIEGRIKINNDFLSLELKNGMDKRINLKNIIKKEIISEKEIVNRITTGRILILGLYSLAFPKEEIKVKNYLVFKIKEMKEYYNIIISTTNIQSFYNEITKVIDRINERNNYM